MHVRDWDAAFLSRYDPAAMAEQWHARKPHRCDALLQIARGVVLLADKRREDGWRYRRMLRGWRIGELPSRKLAACAYHSIAFDNWAVEAHLNWRQRTVAGSDFNGVSRYGTCCMNQPEYRAYEWHNSATSPRTANSTRCFST